jgi:hypothetical protein
MDSEIGARTEESRSAAALRFFDSKEHIFFKILEISSKTIDGFALLMG